MRHHHRSAVGAVAALLALVGSSTLAACGTAPTPEPAPTTTASAVTDPPVFHPDLATWALPLDDYRPDVRRLQDATAVGYAACMTAHGYPTPAADVAATIPVTRNRVLYSLFDVDIATRYGYHAGPAPDPSAASGTPTAPTSAAGRVQAASCSGSAQDAVHLDTGALARVQNLALQARSIAEADPTVLTAVARWTTCMAPLQIADLPSQPVEMPSDSQRTRYHDEAVAVPGSDVTRASADEVARAVVDARCRDSSGYSTTLYRTEIAAQQRILVTDRVVLAASLTASRTATAAVGAVLRSAGG